MSSSTEHHIPSTQSLVKELCKHMCYGIEPSEGARIVKSSLGIITSQDVSFLNSSLSDNDEFAVVEKIKKHLKLTGREHVVTHFDALHRKLVTVSHTVLKNRSAILTLFLRLSEGQGGSSLNGNIELGKHLSQRSFDSLAISGSVASVHSGRSRAGSDLIQRSPGYKIPSATMKQSNVDSLNWSNGLPKDNSYSVNVNTDRRTNQRSERPETITRSVNSTPPRTPRTGKFEVSEVQILQELLFCFQGIEGSILKLDTDNGFKIDPMASVPQPHMVRTLMELGYLHNCVQGLCQELEEGGAVARALTCAIRTELTNYYCTVAQLNSDLKQSLSLSEDSPMSEETLSYAGLSLRRLYVWVREPMWKFQILTDICRVCVKQRGGAVVSSAYTFSYHGDPQAQRIAASILTAATRPLFTLMCHWIIQGELYDPDDEFFVAVNKMCLSHNRWKDKYLLRKELVPAVMSEKQAMMVLNAGKCINFLNDICQQKMPVTGARAKLRQLESSQGGELLQLAEPASPLAIIIESAFMEASQLVLETLKTQFKLYENFQGLRQYMLMGQGDFYRYLIQLLEPELNKNVEQVYNHNLISILETAIRATNAQFEDKEILSRVSVTMLEPSAGDTGWDVFNVVYCTSGPLDTVFQLSDGTYQAMFLFLWQLKRVEYSLSNFRKQQTCVLKKLQRRTDFSELQAMLNHMSLVTAEMVHYINQVQYYILFEVIECSFESFAKKFASATTIEQVIHDHEIFLQEIKMKTLRDESAKSQLLSTLMSSLNLSILNLLSFGSQFLGAAEEELVRRWEREQQILKDGTCYKEEAQHKLLVRQFSSRVLHASKEVGLISCSYQVTHQATRILLQSVGWIK
ncbi:gamma-tubulin complex component 3 isoform X2 [Homalodisca vitripennis]|uniref:gamma-tubulin complex component 3 isoform X2 n=1 Tax=Homalodisca vitripennis TaxID=197043 RepID=UPI001EEADCDD|nr:gamma-tubulin complex component 3 isoform X2 [Homalodisca vitripennis]